MRFLCVALVVVAAAGLAAAQDGQQSVLVLQDGSRVVAEITTRTIALETPYGALAIPIANVRSVNFRTRLPDAETKRMNDALPALLSASYKSRAEAEKILSALSRGAIAPIESFSAASGDAEAITRSTVIVERIRTRDRGDIFQDDVVTTSDNSFRGKLKNTSVQAKSSTLGDLSIDTSSIASIRRLVDHAGTVDAGIHTGKGSDCLNTGLNLKAGDSIVFIASGRVDLWPQTPGQHMSGPDGVTGAIHGPTGRQAGSLIGRIGNGEWFVIGSARPVTVAADGILYLAITPNPWNGASSGTYNVRVTLQP